MQSFLAQERPRSLLIGARVLESWMKRCENDGKLFLVREVASFESPPPLAKPDRAKIPRSRPSITVLARAIFYYIRAELRKVPLGAGSILKCWRIRRETTTKKKPSKKRNRQNR